MADLFAQRRAEKLRAVEPLAVRVRPRTLDEVVGQTHILGPGKLLRRMVDSGSLTSIILHGPPGTGKTTLAEVIARATGRHFERENAASVGVARIRQIIEQASERLAADGRRTVLFLDEIHRFSKSQQDALLADVERGVLTLIGATTENPLFAVNSALVSRSTLFRLEPLTTAEIGEVVRRAVADRERGYGTVGVSVDDDAVSVWAEKSDGDARRALTALEVAVVSSTPASGGTVRITRAIAEESIQQKAVVYDATGDGHYDTISAFIKCVRAGDPDAALYWLALMLEAGEDPRFIARRLAILASEDIGNADPRGILVASAAWELVERVGMPEARITLAQCTTYLALAPKSNASYAGIEAALRDVREGRTVAVPSHIKDGNVRKAGQLSAGTARGERYEYTHDAGAKVEGLGVVGTQDYLGVNKTYYHPGDTGYEKTLAERLAEARRLRADRRGQA
jgi:putative ATPase